MVKKHEFLSILSVNLYNPSSIRQLFCPDTCFLQFFSRMPRLWLKLGGQVFQNVRSRYQIFLFLHK